jgi:hypothetical protein
MEAVKAWRGRFKIEKIVRSIKAMNSENGPGDRKGGSLRDTDKAFEKLLDRLLAKCDSTKNDLESLWQTQILSVGLSVAVVLGLGEILAKKYLESEQYKYALYYILPLERRMLN